MDLKYTFFWLSVLTIMLVFAFTESLFARIIQVGPGRLYTLPSEATSVAVDGDTVEIDAAEYPGDVAAWYQNNLVIRGVGGRPHLRANGNEIYGKGTWVTIGNNITVENIEFSEASVPDENGAGIRQEGYGLTVSNCYFHDNENGMLCDGGNLTIEYCEFNRNGLGYGYTHNIYVVAGDIFTFRFNYSHHAKIGHNVKSRSDVNYIEYNRIMDEASGISSYAIDIPDGGLTYIIGNLIQQGPFTDNFSAILSYAAESASNPIQNLYVINNTFVNDYGSDGAHIYTRPGTTAKIQNNIFARGGTVLTGPGDLIYNWVVDNPNLVDIDNYDYLLTQNSTGAIDQGSDPGEGNGYNLHPLWHYVHPVKKEARIQYDEIDIGAYEFDSSSDLNAEANLLPQSYRLEQNYPNPFNPKTFIAFQLPQAEMVTIDIYNTGGQRILRLVNKKFPAGRHIIELENSDISSGVYFYSMKTANYQKTRKMIVVH